MFLSNTWQDIVQLDRHLSAYKLISQPKINDKLVIQRLNKVGCKTLKFYRKENGSFIYPVVVDSQVTIINKKYVSKIIATNDKYALVEVTATNALVLVREFKPALVMLKHFGKYLFANYHCYSITSLASFIDKNAAKVVEYEEVGRAVKELPLKDWYITKPLQHHYIDGLSISTYLHQLANMHVINTVLELELDCGIVYAFKSEELIPSKLANILTAQWTEELKDMIVNRLTIDIC